MLIVTNDQHASLDEDLLVEAVEALDTDTVAQLLNAGANPNYESAVAP